MKLESRNWGMVVRSHSIVSKMTRKIIDAQKYKYLKALYCNS